MADDTSSGTRQHDLEMAARFRAAIAYKGLGVKDVAEKLGVAPRTVHRLSSGESPIGRELQERLPEVTGVPGWFIQHGFDPPAQGDDATLPERVEALEQQMRTALFLITGDAAEALGIGRRAPRGGSAGDAGKDPSA